MRLASNLAVSNDPLVRYVWIMAVDQRRNAPKLQIQRPPIFIIIIKDDRDAPTVDVPITGVPADLPISQEAVCTTVIADDPMVRPENLPPVSIMTRRNRLASQDLILFGRGVCKIRGVEAYEFDGRKTLR